MPDLLKKQPEETPEVAYADKWLQRLLTYIPLPFGVLSVIYNQTYITIICFLWLATAFGYAIVKNLRKVKPQKLGLLDNIPMPKSDNVFPIKPENKRLSQPLLEKTTSKIILDGVEAPGLKTTVNGRNLFIQTFPVETPTDKPKTLRDYFENDFKFQ